MNNATVPLLWANCVDRIKDQVNNRSFWEALEHTAAITIEEGQLIIGLDSLNFNRASHIQQSSHLNAVQRVVEERFGQALKVRLIEGTTLADWEAAKQRDARVAAMRQAERNRPVLAEATPDNWDGLYDHLSRLYVQTNYRSLPQGKARYANEALYTLMEAMDTLCPEGADEAAERNLARSLERIANNSEIPAPVLAFELERLLAWRRSSEETAE